MIHLYPTDTVFGLGVDARSAQAVRALRALKGSRGEKHYSVAVSDLEMMREYAEMTPLAECLAKNFLPGKLTIILNAKNLPRELSDDGTIGVRIPDHPVVHELIKKIGGPITATSANVSGQQTQKTVPEILKQFGDRAQDITFDPSWPTVLPESLPSTVVDARGYALKIIRDEALLARVLLEAEGK